MSQPPIHRIDAADKRGLAFASFLQAEIGEQFDVAISDVSQSLGRGARVGRGQPGSGHALGACRGACDLGACDAVP